MRQRRCGLLHTVVTLPQVDMRLGRYALLTLLDSPDKGIVRYIPQVGIVDTLILRGINASPGGLVERIDDGEAEHFLTIHA